MKTFSITRFVAIAAIVWLVVSTASLGAVFYVDGASPACSNAGPGSTTVPYCTISAAAAAHNGAGVTILVRPAVYKETVTLTGSSGAAGNPFIIQAATPPMGTPAATLEGSDDFTGSGLWTLSSGNVYLAPSVTWSPVQVFVDGVRLAVSTAAPASMPAQTFQFVSGTGLYVNIGGGNPGTHTTLVGHRLYGFRLSGKSYVRIEGFTILRTDDRSIYLSSSSNNCEIKSNTVTYAGSHGIGVTTSNGVLVEHNTVGYSGDHGIYLTNGDTGCIVQDNESFGNARPLVRAANGINLTSSSGNLIQRNRLHDNQDTGEQINSGSNNNISLQNISWNNGDHGFDHLTSTGSIHIGDVAYHNYKDGFSFEGNSPGSTLWDAIAVDNGLTTAEFNLWVDAASSVNFHSDYDIIWNSTSQSPIKIGSATGSTQYATIAAFRLATGNETHGIQADPQWVNRAAADFHLLTNSPAVDSADSSVGNWPPTDAENHARVDVPSVPNTGAGPVPYADRGALEYIACSVEICDAIDNDCDGSIDEGFNVGAPCTVGVGACAASGQIVCSADHTAGVCSASPSSPSTEICDGVDNDCDGSTDEGNPGGGVPCGTDTGECVAGLTVCSGGALQCPGSVGPAPELCDGLDNNCDGTPDNGFDVGAACTSGLGVCVRPGTKVCAPGGAGTVCNAQPGEPLVEACNGLDDDCDGSTDEDFDVGAPCSEGQGACFASGNRVCSRDQAGTVCNAAVGVPHAESCDHIDNDCDGTVDNGNPGGGAQCGTTDAGECAFGVTDCQAGTLVCVGNIEPVPELCDGLDNDCDGTIDNGFDIGAGCTSGLGACARPGVRICSPNGSTWVCNGVPGDPSTETCDGIDNDCDGSVDEGFGAGLPCANGTGQCARPGVNVCTGNGAGTFCNAVPGEPAPEQCDHLDNDCDGTIDNGNPGSGAQCGTTDVGECAYGVTDCQAGALVCLGSTEPVPELCDGLDNDCDGTIDNSAAPHGFNSLGLSPSRGPTLLSWTAPGSSSYDLVRGSLSFLRSSLGNFTIATSLCLADDAATASFQDSSVPSTSDGFWYLVRGRNACGMGTYDTGASSQIGSRDAEIAASPNACP
jgi:parallel beta-helix repeat protein